MIEAPRESYLGPYPVEAFNASKESENKIHTMWSPSGLGSEAASCRASMSTPI